MPIRSGWNDGRRLVKAKDRSDGLVLVPRAALRAVSAWRPLGDQHQHRGPPLSMFSDPPSPGAKPDHPLTETAPAGQFGGPTYTYRDARIDCMKGRHVCRLTMDGHPLTGMSFGVAGTITPRVGLWQP